METTKKIVLIGPTSERYKGGIAQFTRYLADKLAEQGQLRFISWHQLYPGFLISRDFRDRVSKTSTGSTPAEFTLGYMNPLSWWRTIAQIKQYQPQVICMTWSHAVHAPIYTVLNFFLRRGTSAEIIYICHNVLPHESFFGARWLTKLALKGASRIVVHGKSEAEQATALLNNKACTKLFLPLFDFFSTASDRATSRRAGTELLFFGIIRHYKGLDILLRALPIVRERYPDIHLTIAGERFYQQESARDKLHGKEEDPLSLIDELGLQETVTADLRYIPNEEVADIFSRADVAIFPYRSATQSGPITVAYSHRVPVITTQVGGLPDVVCDGESGYLVESEDPQSLADAIVKYIENPISAEQVDNIAQQLSWERYIDGLLHGGDFTLRPEMPRAKQAVV